MSSSQVKYMDSSGMDPYPDYKDSGIEWIGEIPEHWDVTKLKHMCNKYALYGANISADEYTGSGIRFLRTTDIDDYGNLHGEGVHVTKSAVSNYIVEDGDILISRSGTIGRSFLYDSTKHPICAYAGYLVRYKSNSSTYSKFIFYFTKSAPFIHWINQISLESTIGNVNGQKYANMEIPFVPLPEQQAIATFLDRETSRIDALVEKKQQFIELLEERRSALISHTVTKGLDPDVPMKDSGIEWIGEIPEHWDTIRIKHATYVKGRIGWHGLRSDEFIDEGPFLVTGTDFVNGIVNWNSCYHVSKDRYDQDPYIQLKENDLLITKDGTIGKVALVKGLKSEATLNSGIFVTRPLSNNYITDFMYWILNSEVFTAFFEYMSNGTTIQHLYQNVFNEFAFPIPPLQEQQAIANYLDRETSQIDNLIEKTEQSIEYLKEYRTALISSAVTGKIDVRGTVSD
ncbi:type I restriction enzyme S subunit [Methanohalophilus euhalobius]|uniref:Type I restriction enzyme S subunit n=1 Tax=Methanohalophilus euhalobius TaxID=51203 RepID=A0A285END1_9EURY|nr:MULTISPECIES: restriction endonuclease subunit S [Methanohalophilus]ODV49426.1 MAG: type I restriction enzyme, S subunit [Methanohalophilus sp. 2-GBenrich]TCL11187.1 type I restriction enzyme S subunit [Methanohalophilus euhalobius]SNY00540.1 type I restriction enzyme, S subunit [Methanohalophilus euhalobius]